MTYVNQSLYETMLSHLRPMDTGEEVRFLLLLQRTLLALGYEPDVDAAGNMWVSIGESRTLFVAHTDTAGNDSGLRAPTFKDGVYSSPDGMILGADDTSGIYVLLTLLEKKVPGTYLFTRGEEAGGVGAVFVARYAEDKLKQFDRAVAFDRRGVTSVITHQGGSRCASDEFAEALSDQLNNLGLLYMPDNTGIYTDTAEFVGIIPECTNLSVGYQGEHSCREVQSWDHLEKLAEAAVLVDWESLPVVRKPCKKQRKAMGWWYAEEEDPLDEAVSSWYIGDAEPLKRLLVETFEESDRDTAQHLIDLSLLSEDDVDEVWATADLEGLLAKAWRH